MDLPLAMVGVGGLGYLQAKAFDRIDGVRLLAAADVAPEARRLFEEEFGAPAYEHYRQLLHEHGDSLAAVVIVTPHALHYEQAKAAIEQGLHVLVEKPMVTDVSDALDLVDSAADNDVVLQVGYQRHFNPAFREIRRLIADGRLGDIHTVSCYMAQDWIDNHRGSWRTDPAMSGGGQLYDSGSHLLDALLWTTGADPTSVTATIDFADPGVDVNSAVTMEMDQEDSSLVASVGVTGDGMAVEPDEGYVFWGSDGRLRYDGSRIEVKESGVATYAGTIENDVGFDVLNRRKIENFAASIEGTVDPAVSGEVGLAVTALTEAIYEAAASDSRVAVDQLIERAREPRA